MKPENTGKPAVGGGKPEGRGEGKPEGVGGRPEGKGEAGQGQGKLHAGYRINPETGLREDDVWTQDKWKARDKKAGWVREDADEDVDEAGEPLPRL
jgi:hypothetical protein